MFFKKLLRNIDISLPEASNNKAPIYIVGVSPLAIFLGATLQNAGENVIMVSNAANCKKLSDEGITLKEEYNLQKKLYHFNATSLIKEEPKLIILAAETHNLKSHLTFLPGKTYSGAPMLCFNHLEHPEVIRPLLGCNFYPAYVNGFLQADAGTVAVFGRPPHFSISKAHPENVSDLLFDTMSATGCKITFNEQNAQNYWSFFAPYALGFLSSSPKTPLTETLKDKGKKAKIATAASELSMLAGYCKAKISTEEIMRQLAEAPHDYCFKPSSLSQTAEAAELDTIYTSLSDKARIYKCKTPELNQLMRSNYSTILKK